MAFVSYYVFLHRGVAAKSVVLYAIPIIVSAVLLSRRAIMTTTLLCMASYFIAVNVYATYNFNEGYKIERYGEIFFYCGTMLILAGLLWAVVHAKKRL
jgi:hypothetical protein